MQEHPVPQNVTSYEFHLIGNMTLKQFLELAAGGALAFIVYSTNLPNLLKWPLVFALVGIGAAMAFLPIEERPLDIWFLAFIRAIYNPTKFHWKKTLKVPDIFGFSTKQASSKAPDKELLTKPQRDSRIAAYFQSISAAPRDTEQEDILQHALAITQMYDSVPAARDIAPPQRKQPEPNLEKPSVNVKPHQLKAQGKAGLSGTITISDIKKSTDAVANVVLPTVIASQNLVDRSAVSVMENGAPLTVSRTEPVKTPTAPTKNTQQYRAEQATLQSNPQDLTAVQTSKTLPFPKTPTTPNVVVGMVLDKDGKILENAIVEIRTIQGFPARALKSNRLGQFFASTPLPAGEYEIVVEKEGYLFNQEKLTVNNKVISPLEIRAN